MSNDTKYFNRSRLLPAKDVPAHEKGVTVQEERRRKERKPRRNGRRKRTEQERIQSASENVSASLGTPSAELAALSVTETVKDSGVKAPAADRSAEHNALPGPGFMNPGPGMLMPRMAMPLDTRPVEALPLMLPGMPTPLQPHAMPYGYQQPAPYGIPPYPYQNFQPTMPQLATHAMLLHQNASYQSFPPTAVQPRDSIPHSIQQHQHPLQAQPGLQTAQVAQRNRTVQPASSPQEAGPLSAVSPRLTGSSKRFAGASFATSVPQQGTLPKPSFT